MGLVHAKLAMMHDIEEVDDLKLLETIEVDMRRIGQVLAQAQRRKKSVFGLEKLGLLKGLFKNDDT